MTRYTLAIAGLVAGLVLAAAGLVPRLASAGDPDPDPAPDRFTSVDALEPAHGLIPIGDAVELWRTRSETNELDYLSRTQLGVALADQARQTGDVAGFDDAEVALVEALDLNPDHDPALLALASVHLAQHRFTEARDLAEQVAAADPGSLGALALIGDASIELGDYDRASIVYGELARVERSAPAVARLARLAWIDGDPDRAVDLAAEAVTRSEDDALRPDRAAFYHFQLAHFRFEAGDGSGAVASLTEALAVDPGNGGATELLAAVHAALGDTDAALDLYRAMTDEGAAADVHGAYADLLRTIGDDAEADRQDAIAIELAAETIEEVPAERRHLVGFYLGRDPELAVALAEADLADRAGVESYDALAWALYHAGHHEEAADAIDRALDRGTRSAPLLYHAGMIRLAVGDEAGAQSLLEEALALNPRFDWADAPAAAEVLASLR